MRRRDSAFGDTAFAIEGCDTSSNSTVDDSTISKSMQIRTAEGFGLQSASFARTIFLRRDLSRSSTIFYRPFTSEAKGLRRFADTRNSSIWGHRTGQTLNALLSNPGLRHSGKHAQPERPHDYHTHPIATTHRPGQLPPSRRAGGARSDAKRNIRSEVSDSQTAILSQAVLARAYIRAEIDEELQLDPTRLRRFLSPSMSRVSVGAHYLVFCVRTHTARKLKAAAGISGSIISVSCRLGKEMICSRSAMRACWQP